MDLELSKTFSASVLIVNVVTLDHILLLSIEEGPELVVTLSAFHLTLDYIIQEQLEFWGVLLHIERMRIPAETLTQKFVCSHPAKLFVVASLQIVEYSLKAEDYRVVFIFLWDLRIEVTLVILSVKLIDNISECANWEESLQETVYITSCSFIVKTNTLDFIVEQLVFTKLKSAHIRIKSSFLHSLEVVIEVHVDVSLRHQDEFYDETLCYQ